MQWLLLLNSIVIHSLQQKFSIATSSTEERGGFVGNKNTNNKATIIRRDRCLLMLSKSRLKVMVLRFDSLQDCLDFSDRFIELNPPPMDEEVQPQDPDEREADRETVTAHLVRLMHDPSFTTFVRNVEEVISSSTDGTRLLESWADNELMMT